MQLKSSELMAIDLVSTLPACQAQFHNFDMMGFNAVEMVILNAAGHTVAMGLEGAAFDHTPDKFDLAWFEVRQPPASHHSYSF